jgi:hypothetical protein
MSHLFVLVRAAAHIDMRIQVFGLMPLLLPCSVVRLGSQEELSQKSWGIAWLS